MSSSGLPPSTILPWLITRMFSAWQTVESAATAAEVQETGDGGFMRA